ncbi:SHOCT domain-containing protein [Dethiothermospora halolimnae]|uniref:SHOCT domain-containing protein n=1 Tax=Dethiothermospora halolimnae TaxID=3114390 RepID=UPI003CCC4528
MHHGFNMMDHMFGYGYLGGNSWWWMLGIGLLKLALAIVAIVLIVKLVKKDRYKTDNYYTSKKAVEVLKERYVLGEISDEEYERKLKVLDS